MRSRPFGRLSTAVSAGLLLVVTTVAPAMLSAPPAAAAPAGDLVVNGSFESPVAPNGSFLNAPTIPGWAASNGCGIELQRHSTPAVAFDGEQNAELDSDCPTTITQTIATTPGTAYLLTYAFSPRPGIEQNAMDVTVDGAVVAQRSADGRGLTAAAWQTYTETFRAQTASTTLGFADRTVTENSFGTLLDAVSVVAAPPPYTDPGTVAENTSWPNAALLPEARDTTGRLGGAGEARWYRFPVVPGSTVRVDLTGLAADADLALFRDIGAAFTTLTTAQQSLPRLGAEFAADVFSPSVYSPSVYSPSVYSPAIFSPSVYSPSVYSPSVYSPSVYSPSVYSPSVYSPSVYSPSVYSPSVYSPSVYSPSQTFIDAFSGAQTRSLIGVSAHDGIGAESVQAATWNSTGSFYVRVQSRDGAAATPFTVRLTTTGGPCNGFTLNTGTGTGLPATPGAPTTVVLTDTARLGLTGADKTAYLGKLGALGTVVDADAVARTKLLNAQADAHPQCPYAKNLVAQSLRDLVNGYRSGNLRYVVIAGPDTVVPFFRYADDAGLGPESDYVPPVRDDTASQGSLRNNFLLGQDAYGTVNDVTVKGSVLPVPDLAVGRLVETPAEITSQVDRYLGHPDGVLPRPGSSLVTGYDFLTSAADSVQRDLAAGLGAGAQTLITDQGVPTTVTTAGAPDRRHSWTADDLRAQLFGSRHDLVFLAGHFSSASALAADYETSVTTTEIALHPGQFTDSVVFSPGCHSGYSVADTEGIPGLTPGLDWAQVMAQQGATLVAGTGYQYADTDFLAYSAKLYAQFAHQLRAGSPGTPVRLGEALVQAKQDYLAGLGSLSGIDIKSLLQATLYGLPMTGLDLPGRAAAAAPAAAVNPLPVAGGTPGAVLGLRRADLSPPVGTEVHTRQVVDLAGRPTGADYRWLTGPDGVQTEPALPALPLSVVDVTSSDGVLRGVGWRSGSYTDTAGTTPLTGAPGTEHNGIHTSFGSTSFFPHRLATPNFFGALAGSADGRTRLAVTPAQYRAESTGGTSTERRYTGLGLQLFYSSNIASYGGNTPALAAPPSISQVTGTTSADRAGLTFSARVTGDPSAGIQSAWVTYTAESGPLHGTWQSVDLAQSGSDSTVWTGALGLPSGQDPAAVRFLVQAVNGVGLVALDDALGDGYLPQSAGPPPAKSPTSLALASGTPRSGRYSDTVSVPVRLSGAPAGSQVTVSLGLVSATAVTGACGTATVRLPLRTAVGSYVLTASYAGDATHAPSQASQAGFTVAKAATRLAYTGGSGPVPVTGDPSRIFTLTSNGVPLQSKAVLLDVYSGSGGRIVHVTRVIRNTDLFGRVDLGGLALVRGKLGVLAVFGVGAGGTSADPSYGPSVSAAVLDVR